MGILRRTVSNVVAGTCMGITFMDLIASTYEIEGASMQPTLNPFLDQRKDIVLVEKVSRWRNSFQRGDVVVLRAPDERGKSVVKRLVALEGDSIIAPGRGHGGVVTVPKGCCWVEGDNRARSADSLSSYGSIPIALLEGRVTHVVWPQSRWSWVSNRPMDASRVIRLGER